LEESKVKKRKATLRQNRRNPDVWEVYYRWQGKAYSPSFGGDHDLAEKVCAFVTAHLPELNDVKPDNVFDIHRWFRTMGVEGLTALKPEPKTLSQLIDLYYAHLDWRQNLREGVKQRCSAFFVTSQRWGVDYFKGYCDNLGATELQDVFATPFLLTYREYIQVAKYRKGKNAKPQLYSPYSVNCLALYLKLFILWAYDEDYIDLPRKLKDYHAVMDTDAPAPKPYTLEQLQTIFGSKHLTERTRCFVLLALNLAWTSIDLATFANKHINWDTGIIERPRHKTGQLYRNQLWPETLRLVRQFHSGRTGPDDLVFVTRTGAPFSTEYVTPAGKPMQSDKIYELFRWVLNKEDVPGSFKLLRKTGPEFVSNHFGKEHQYLVNEYLAHSKKALIALNYVTDGSEELIGAVKWFGAFLQANGIQTQ
jgi:integrase